MHKNWPIPNNRNNKSHRSMVTMVLCHPQQRTHTLCLLLKMPPLPQPKCHLRPMFRTHQPLLILHHHHMARKGLTLHHHHLARQGLTLRPLPFKMSFNSSCKLNSLVHSRPLLRKGLVGNPPPLHLLLRGVWSDCDRIMMGIVVAMW